MNIFENIYEAIINESIDPKPPVNGYEVIKNSEQVPDLIRYQFITSQGRGLLTLNL